MGCWLCVLVTVVGNSLRLFRLFACGEGIYKGDFYADKGTPVEEALSFGTATKETRNVSVQVT